MTKDEFVQAVKTNKLPDINRSREYLPVTQALAILQGKWRNRILYELLSHGRMRYSEIKKSVPEITNRMLTKILRDLESYDLILRIEYDELSPHVEYDLTEKGNDLLPVYYEIFEWADKHLNKSHGKNGTAEKEVL
jgi:DNA-binding HxlR family transcriptional regulator